MADRNKFKGRIPIGKPTRRINPKTIYTREDNSWKMEYELERWERNIPEENKD